MLFSVSFKESLLQRSKFKNSVETVNPFVITMHFCILQLPISYCVSLTMVTITSYGFINIVQTEHFSAVLKFDMSYKKRVSFLVITKSPKAEKKKKKKKKKKTRTGLL